MTKEKIKAIADSIPVKQWARSINSAANSSLRIWLMDQTNFLPEDSTTTQRFYHILNDVMDASICIRGKNKPFNGMKMEYRKFCGVGNDCQCRVEAKKSEAIKFHMDMTTHERDEIQRKMKETNLKRYGVENAAQSFEIKAKIQETIIERYGVDHYSKTHEFKEKIREASLKNYGTEHYTQSEMWKQAQIERNQSNFGYDWPVANPETYDKVKATNVERYGVENQFQRLEKIKEAMVAKHGVRHALQSKEIVKKMQEEFEAKYGEKNPMQVKEFYDKQIATMVERHGVPYSFQMVEALKTYQVLLDQYGVTNISQIPEVQEKKMKSGAKAKHMTLPSGKEIYYRGWENHVIYELIDLGITEEEFETDATKMPQISYFFEGKNSVYFPDIFIKAKNLLIEVKSDYTMFVMEEKNNAKQEYTTKAGYRHHILIVDLKTDDWKDELKTLLMS